MNFLEAIIVVIAPLIPVVLPGAFFIHVHDFKNLLISGARIILLSMSIMTITLTAGLYVGTPVWMIAMLFAILSATHLVVHRKRFFARPTIWHAMAMIIPMVLGLALFAMPFFIIHDGLPTGDVQKTILWSQESITTHHLPEYAKSILLLNRDPVDFYTPGLHAVSSLVMSLSPAPLTSMGLFAIVVSLCVAWIAGALTKEMFDNHPHVIPPVLAGIFTLTQYRFLRYLREPGYHFQNVVGELFLFGMILLYIRFIRRRERQDAVLFLLVGAALFLTHQFSMFIAVFALTGAMIATVMEYRTRIIHTMKMNARVSLGAMAFGILALAIASSLQLGNKLPALFTKTPHLTGLLPSIVDYPVTMGTVWFFTGLIGVVLMVVQARRKDEHHRQIIAFASATAVIVALSQGPVLGIDIPPVRALFYIVVPFSVAAAYLFGKLFLAIRHSSHGNNKRTANVILVAVILGMCTSSTYRAYASLSHTVRTNSTLTGEELGLIEKLRSHPLSLPLGQGEESAILVDDYNRRSASWLVLSGRPMFTRIAADLHQQMQEAHQSKLRMDLYLKQLDFEKIFSLGSMPEITNLFAKHAIGAVTGIADSSQKSFMHNPALRPFAVADDITLYGVEYVKNDCKLSAECTFLLRSATLANDIGDNQDTFEHLQASIRSPRLSEPLVSGNVTYRESNATHIPLEFNVDDYVRVLWDPNNTNRPESALRVVIYFTKPYQGLLLKTPSGRSIAIPNAKHATVELRQDMVQIDDRGFVTLVIDNPHQERIGIDLIALGPSLIL